MCRSNDQHTHTQGGKKKEGQMIRKKSWSDNLLNTYRASSYVKGWNPVILLHPWTLYTLISQNQSKDSRWAFLRTETKKSMKCKEFGSQSRRPNYITVIAIQSPKNRED